MGSGLWNLMQSRGLYQSTQLWFGMGLLDFFSPDVSVRIRSGFNSSSNPRQPQNTICIAIWRESAHEVWKGGMVMGHR